MGIGDTKNVVLQEFGLQKAFLHRKRIRVAIRTQAVGIL